MGDVADILGGAPRAQVSEGDALLMDGPKPGAAAAPAAQKGKRKPAGMSREVFNLIGKEGMAPAIVSKKPVGLKDKREGTARTRWVWTNFKNSGRSDGDKEGTQVFYHWVKAATDYPDYPFARFNVQTPAVEFTEAEYTKHLVDPAWSKAETELLLELCRRFDLRWPVIHDRFAPPPAAATASSGPGAEEKKEGEKKQPPQRSIEDLQARYYKVRKTLRVARQDAALAEAVQGGLPPQPVMFQPGLDEDGDTFDHPYERKRRQQLEYLFKRSKEDELEELRLREELKTIDAALKRVKKHPHKSAVRDPAEAKAATTTEMTANGPRVMPLVNERSVVEARPEPKPGHPFLQSARLTVPMGAPRLQKGMLQKVKQLLTDLGLAPRPLPTKTVCDLYDDLRRDMVELFTLQKLVRQKEQQVDALKAGQDPAMVFSRQMLGAGSVEGGVGGGGGGMGGGGGPRGLAMGPYGGGGGGQKKSSHKKAQSIGRQGSGGSFGGGGLAHAGSDSSLSTADERKRKRP